MLILNSLAIVRLYRVASHYLGQFLAFCSPVFFDGLRPIALKRLSFQDFIIAKWKRWNVGFIIAMGFVRSDKVAEKCTKR